MHYPNYFGFPPVFQNIFQSLVKKLQFTFLQKFCFIRQNFWWPFLCSFPTFSQNSYISPLFPKKMNFPTYFFTLAPYFRKIYVVLV